MSPIFRVVYEFLQWAARMTGLTYEEVNVVVYYIFVPAVFFALIDRIIKRPVCLLVFSGVVLLAFIRIDDFALFSEQLFNSSVRFLLGFSKFGIGYDMASVILCVVMPLVLFIFLAILAFPHWSARFLPTFAKFTGKFRRI